MKRCALDGETLRDAAAVYRALGKAFGFPNYFGDNPDALWDSLSDYDGEPVEVIWRAAARSAERLGAEFDKIAAVLRQAAAEGRLTLRFD